MFGVDVLVCGLMWWKNCRKLTDVLLTIMVVTYTPRPYNTIIFNECLSLSNMNLKNMILRRIYTNYKLYISHIL